MDGKDAGAPIGTLPYGCGLTRGIARLFLGPDELVTFQGSGDIERGLARIQLVSPQYFADTAQTNTLFGCSPEADDVFDGRPDFRFFRGSEQNTTRTDVLCQPKLRDAFGPVAGDGNG